MKIFSCGFLSVLLLAVASLTRGSQAQIAAATKPIKKTFTTISIPPKPASSKAVQKASPKLLPISTKMAVGLGMILAFNSGIVNGACLSGLLAEGTKQATAAVTGAWTNSALGMAKGNSAQFLLNAKCILSYMGGSMISSLLVPRPTPFVLDVNRSLPCFAIASGLLVGAASLAEAKNINYLFLCCLANGIQNSLTSTLTGNLCRTAHYSGITSDLGTFLGQVLRGNTANLLKLKSFALLAACFWAGGFLSFGLTESFGSVVLEGAALTQLMFALVLGLKAFGVM